MGWLSGWSYRKEVTLVEQSSAAYNDLPTIITAIYDAHMKTDFADCRFTESDGTTLIAYGIKTKTDDIECQFVIKRDYTSGASLTVYLYYGNAAASDASVDYTSWCQDWYINNGFGLNPSAHQGSVSCVIYNHSESDTIPAWAEHVFGGCTANGSAYAFYGHVKINGTGAKWASTSVCFGKGNALRLRWDKYNCTDDMYDHASFVKGASNTVTWGHYSGSNSGFWVSWYPAEPSVSFGAEELSGIDLAAQFEVGQDSVGLLARAEVGQDSEDFYARFEVGQDSADLLGKIEAQVTADLLGNAVIRNIGSADLLGNVEVQQSGFAELLGKFAAQATAELLGEFVVNQWQEDLPGGFVVRHSGPVPWTVGWAFRKSHTITGSIAGAQTNYPVGIKVYYDPGTDGTEVVGGTTFGKIYCDSKCRIDFGDIRFTKSDETSLLDYWIEEQVDSDYAIIWVEVDSIPASPSTVDIYIYYGNPSATTTSDGDATFTFFDDFTIDRGWMIGNGTFIQIIDPEDVLWIDYRRPASNLYCYRSVSGLADGFELLIDSWYDITPAGDDWVAGIFSLSVNNNGSRHGESEIYGIRGWGTAYGNKHGLIYWNGVAAGGSSDGDADPNSDRFIYRIRKHDTRLEYYCSSGNVADGTEVVTAGIPAIAYMKAWITNSQAGTAGDDCRKKIHLIRIRKWVFPEPTHTTWGPETAATAIGGVLPAQFFVNQWQEDLHAEFEVGQDSAELLGKVDITHSVDLLSKTVIRHPGSAEFLGRAEIRQSGSAELLGGFEVGQGSAELPARFLIPRAYDLSSGMGISFDWWGSGGVDQNIDFEMWSLTGGWVGRFPDGPAEWRQVQLSWDDLTPVDLDGTRPDSSQIIGIYWTYHTPGVRRVDGIRAWMRQNLLCKVTIKNVSASDLLSRFEIQASQDLLCKFETQFTQGFNDLKAGFYVEMVILRGGLWDYQYVWQNLAAELEVGAQQGQIEVDPATGAITARQRHAINDRNIITMCGGYRAYSKGTFIFDAEASIYSGANPVYTPAFGLVENKYDWFTGASAHAAMLYSDGAGGWNFYTEDDGDTESTAIIGIDFTTQHTFKIIWEDASEYPATGRVRLYIDDVLKATHETAVPTHPLLFFLLMDSYIVAYSTDNVWTKLYSFSATGVA